MWFDAHAAFETPDTTTTGFADGMGLAITVGHCWSAITANVSGFRPVRERNVVLAGTREISISSTERVRLEDSEITAVRADLIRRKGWAEALGVALDKLRTSGGEDLRHLDLDVLDPAEVGTANEFAGPGGLVWEELEAAIRMIRERFGVTVAGIASYDPAFDEEGAVPRAALASSPGEREDTNSFPLTIG